MIAEDGIGLSVLAFIGIRANRACSELLEPLKRISAIEECHSVAGGMSLILKLRVPNSPALLDLSERLRQIPGIERTKTTIVLKTQIDKPVALDEPMAPGRIKRDVATGKLD